MNDFSIDDTNTSSEQIKFLKDFTDKKLIKLLNELLSSDQKKETILSVLNTHTNSIKNECSRLANENKLTYDEVNIITNRFHNATFKLFESSDIMSVYSKLSKKNRLQVKNVPNNI